ncbi:MAG: ABC transporter ATP-binding protein [Alphaproteobacteria bacterium]
MKNSQPLLELVSVSKSFQQGEQTLRLWENVSLALNPGEIVALVGASGAGKSTLLQVAGLLERPTTGEVIIGGQSCSRLSDNERTQRRRHDLGFVYQYHLLLPEFSALENVMIPQSIAGVANTQARAHAETLLTSLGLESRLHHRPKALSGGEQQRVAVARALANSPQILLADEPTGNLDNATADKVFKELITLVRGKRIAALIATHNQDMAQQMDRILVLKNGCLSF